jgi:hypothetical protein
MKSICPFGVGRLMRAVICGLLAAIVIPAAASADGGIVGGVTVTTPSTPTPAPTVTVAASTPSVPTVPTPVVATSTSVSILGASATVITTQPSASVSTSVPSVIRVSKPSTSHAVKRKKGARAQERRTLLSFTLTTQNEEPIAVTTPGCTEMVALTGAVHQEFHITVSDDGNSLHINSTDDSHGVKGLGVTSGVQYVSSDVITRDLNVAKGENLTVVDRFLLNAQGETLSTTLLGDDLYMRDQMHLTVNANGALTVAFDNPTVECR